MWHYLSWCTRQPMSTPPVQCCKPAFHGLHASMVGCIPATAVTVCNILVETWAVERQQFSVHVDTQVLQHCALQLWQPATTYPLPSSLPQPHVGCHQDLALHSQLHITHPLDCAVVVVLCARQHRERPTRVTLHSMTVSIVSSVGRIVACTKNLNRLLLSCITSEHPRVLPCVRELE
jgi:hypothetical protein